MPFHIYAHDAGPANILHHAYSPLENCILQFEGPALDIYPEHSSNTYHYPLVNIEGLITGTSISSFKHLSLINSCRNMRILSIAAIEHYKNIRERFVCPKSQRLILPDFIYIYDRSAELISKCLPEIPSDSIIVKPNFYQQYLVQSIASLYHGRTSTDIPCQLLYISEPASQFNPTNCEFKCFSAFLEYASKRFDLGRHVLSICLHPAESTATLENYRLISTASHCQVLFYRGLRKVPFNLVHSVYGRDSMALQITALADIPTYSVFRASNPEFHLISKGVSNLGLL